MSDLVVGVAIGMRSGRRCILTEAEYLALDRASWDRWEFISIRRDPETGSLDAAELESLGWPGGTGYGWPAGEPDPASAS